MSSTTTTINFSCVDYRGEQSLSSYAIPITPFFLTPDLSELALSAINSHKVIWDFGDGTTSKSFSAVKSYEFPGIYDINLVIYDCNNNALISTQTKIVQVYDYLPYTFNIRAYGRFLTEDGSYIISEDGSYIVSEVPVIEIKAGKIEGSFNFESTYPAYQPPTSIYYEVSGSDSNNYWEIYKNKFEHLDNSYAIYEQTYNFSISANQYHQLKNIQFDVSDIYAKVSEGSVIRCSKEDINSCLVGRSGNKDVYIKDDAPSQNSKWKFFFDKTKNKLPFYNGNTNHLNNLAIVMSLSVLENTPDHLSITSNGLDGEGVTVDSFNINPIKYFDTKIPFVIRIKDIDNFSIKDFQTIQLSALSITLSAIGNVQIVDENGQFLLNENGEEIYATGVNYLLSNTQYSISSLNYTLSSQDSGGSFRGYIQFSTNPENTILQNVKIYTSATVISNQLSSYELSGSSSFFNVYSKNYFDLYKKNEDFNPEQTLKDLRFQETLLDKEVLFGDFLGGLLGNENSDHEGIGLKIYEKIANFVGNTQDIDTCEEDHIESLGLFLGYNNKNEENYTYPEKIKRILNLASIDKTKLVGIDNKFAENFDIKGRSSKDEYGINTGDIIDPNTYIVTAGIPIVALEKFSNTYSLLNTFQPVSAVGSFTYPLSLYNSDFGWPLVLPSDFDYKDFSKYYIFFEYVDQYDGSVVGSLGDFVNDKTTIDSSSSSSDLYGESGIFQNMFMDTLYQSLSLIN